MPIHDRAFRGGTMLTDDGAARHRPRHHGLTGEHDQLLELQRLAGNQAVANLIAGGRGGGRVTSIDAMEIKRTPMAPEAGVHGIREHATNKQSVALTRRSIIDEPPLFKPDAPEKTKDGYVSKPQKVGAIPEPEIEEWWPTEGNHKIAEGDYLAINHDWEKKLEEGEDEHRDDAKLAWQLTWKVVKDAINKQADKPGPAQSTPEAAEQDAWQRYVAVLPPDLRPDGNRPSLAKQRDVLAVRPGTFMAWMWEITVARDQRNYHETQADAAPPDAKPAPKGATPTGIKGHPDFKVKGPTSEAFIEEIRKKYTPGKIIQGSKMKVDGEPGNATK